jgi:hypothetical protein
MRGPSEGDAYIRFAAIAYPKGKWRDVLRERPATNDDRKNTGDTRLNTLAIMGNLAETIHLPTMSATISGKAP